MRRLIMILAAAVALTGCKIEEAESYEPTRRGYFMFRDAEEELVGVMDDVIRVFFFDLYYSATEEEKENIHNRYFYTSRIYSKGDEWHIVDINREMIICTGGKSLHEEGTTWRYRYADTHYSNESDMPSLTSRAKDGTEEMLYDFALPYGRGLLEFVPRHMSQNLSDGTVRYWVETTVSGIGEFVCEHRYYREDTLNCEITEPLSYNSWHRSFRDGIMKLTAYVGEEKREAEAKYIMQNNNRMTVLIKYNGLFQTYY